MDWESRMEWRGRSKFVAPRRGSRLMRPLGLLPEGGPEGFSGWFDRHCRCGIAERLVGSPVIVATEVFEFAIICGAALYATGCWTLHQFTNEIALRVKLKSMRISQMGDDYRVAGCMAAGMIKHQSGLGNSKIRIRTLCAPGKNDVRFSSHR